jgi:hypothetical protein
MHQTSKAYLRGDFYHEGAVKYGVQGYIVLESTELTVDVVGSILPKELPYIAGPPPECPRSRS